MRAVVVSRFSTVDRGIAAAVACTVALTSVAVTGHPMLALVLAALPLFAVAGAAAVPRIHVLLKLASSETVGLAWVILIVSTFVWRGRTTEALTENPLDAAAFVRVACVVLAGLLLAAHLLRAPLGVGVPLPLKLFVGYVAAAFIAAVASPQPLIASYRALELGVGILAFLAVACEPPQRWTRALDLVLACLAGILVLVWIESMAIPHRAWEQVHGVVPWALTGAMPSFSSNSVGEYGAILGIWGLASIDTRRRGFAAAAALGGIGTLLAAQYRTGIIAFVAALAFVVWRRRQFALALAAVATASLVVASGQSSALRGRAEVVFARGNADTVKTLDSRSIYWNAALPSVRERPIFGWGLNVGTRRVLSALGLQTTSTIHSTWFEALLGTGVVGAALLAGAFLTVIGAALRCRGPDGVAAGGVLIVLTIRSLTGSTVELFDVNTLLLGAVALATAAAVRFAVDAPA
jgi:O-antigen ligase